jgi:hypothetical protein
MYTFFPVSNNHMAQFSISVFDYQRSRMAGHPLSETETQTKSNGGQ